jgi:hypothetical protein
LERTPFLIERDKELSTEAHGRGVVTEALFQHFWNAGYQGLYRETASQIRARKGLTRRQQIGDYVSSSELAHLIFKSSLARDMLITRNVHDAKSAIKTHFEAGNLVRTTLHAANVPTPEMLPTPRKSYRQLLEEQIERERLAEEDQYGLWAMVGKPTQGLTAPELASPTEPLADLSHEEAAVDSGAELATIAEYQPETVEFGIVITIEHQGNDIEYRFASVDYLESVEDATYTVLRLTKPVNTLLHLFWRPDQPEGDVHAESMLALDAYLAQIITQDEYLRALYGSASPLRQDG